MRWIIVLSFAGLALAGASASQADDGPLKLDLTLQNHVWTPAELHVPAGKRAEIIVKNLDDTAEEFDSTDLKVEKVVPANGQGTIRLHALDPGRYSFMGEYHPESAHGVVIVQ